MTTLPVCKHCGGFGQHHHHAPTTRTTTANVAAYLRVSTDRQAEHGLGLDVQRHAIKTWAKQCGQRVVSWHADEGQSGSNGLGSRVALADALGALRSKRASALVVYRLDRLARDLILQETLLADVRRLHCDVFSCSAAESGYLGDDPDDPSRKFIRQMLGGVAELERSMITLRLRSGKQRKKAAGGFAGGQVPFGWRSEGAALVRDEAEQATLARMRELHDAGLSLRQIAATLEHEGHKPKRSDRWRTSSLRRLLTD